MKFKSISIIFSAVFCLSYLSGCGERPLDDESSDSSAATTQTTASVQTTAVTSSSASAATVTTPATTSASSANNSSAAGELGFGLKCSNEWDDGKGKCYEYNAVLVNNMSTKTSDWNVKINVPSGADVKTVWNCKYTLKDGILTITPTEYNSVIYQNASINLGFQLSSSSKIDISSAVFSAGGKSATAQENVVIPKNSTNQPPQASQETQKNAG